MINIYDRLKELDVEIVPPTPKGGIYSPVLHFSEKMLYVSGTGDADVNGKASAGRVGREHSLEQGQQIARKCAINLLSNIHHGIGDLNKIKKFVKLLGFVASTDDFFQQPKVLNGASSLILEIFGEEVGLPARSAIGVNALPNNMPVEIEMLLELK